MRAELRKLEELIDNLELKDDIEFEFQNGRYFVGIQPYENAGFSYKCPRLGRNCYQVFVDESLSEPEQRVVLFHEIVEIYLYYFIGIHPLKKAHEIASEEHNQYAKRRNIIPPSQ